MSAFSTAAVAYLDGHAIVPDVALELGVREVGGALVWPNGRRRLLNGNGHTRQPKGKPLAAWWLSVPKREREQVLVCEGESDALAAVCALRDAPPETGFDGLPVLAAPGTGYPVERLVLELREAEASAGLLALDGDEAGHKYRDKAAQACEQAGIRPVRVELPGGCDLADCLARERRRGAWIANLLADSIADAELVDEDDKLGTHLRLVPLAEFAAAVEPSAEALLGTDDDAAFTAGGTVITYGDGGQGKTTLAIDGLAHLAAGVPWLGLAVPRELRIVVVENEGPRGRFRRKLRRKLETWTGPPFAPNVLALEEPWGGFSFADDNLRGALAGACAEFDADVLVIGPLVSLGAEGGGTPEEVARFEGLLGRFRADLGRPLLVWIAHHENKSGDVSGAWERLPDTLMHVRLEGRKQTKLHWRKVRWSSALHDERWTLRWLEDCEGFDLVDEVERDVRGEILALYEQDPKWRTVSEVADKRERGGIGRRRDDVQQELDELVAKGEFEVTAEAPGRQRGAKCYRPVVPAEGDGS